MRYYILARKNWTWRTGLALARFFREHSFPVYVTEKTSRNISVNWGNSSCINATLNQHIITNKMRQIDFLTSKEIPTLTLYRTNPPRENVLVARRFNHQAGEDITLVKPDDELPVANYFTKFEHFTKEIRIHAFFVDNLLKIRAFKKVIDREEDEFPIRNLTNGYSFKLVGVSEPLENLVAKTLSLLEMDFGCIDVGKKSSEEERYTILEVNSAPSLVNNNNSLYWYGNNIGRRIFPEKWEIIEK